MVGMQTPDDFVVPPVSDREKLLRKIDKRDKAVKAFELILALFIAALVLLSLLRLNQVAESNERGIVNQSQSSEVVHDEIKAYIKCVLLIPRQPSEPFKEARLDSCARDI